MKKSFRPLKISVSLSLILASITQLVLSGLFYNPIMWTILFLSYFIIIFVAILYNKYPKDEYINRCDVPEKLIAKIGMAALMGFGSSAMGLIIGGIFQSSFVGTLIAGMMLLASISLVFITDSKLWKRRISAIPLLLVIAIATGLAFTGLLYHLHGVHGDSSYFYIYGVDSKNIFLLSLLFSAIMPAVFLLFKILFKGIKKACLWIVAE
jgi:hypothetical protein